MQLLQLETKQQQHHQNSMLQQQYYLVKHEKVIVICGETRDSILVMVTVMYQPHPCSIHFMTRKWIKSNTSLSKISFNFLVCRELNSNMTDTSQGRHETAFGTEISAAIKHIIMKQYNCLFPEVYFYDKLPVQSTNAFLVSYSSQGSKCTFVWDCRTSYFLDLQKETY